MNLTPLVLKPRIFHNKKVNIMAADALRPFITRSSAVMVLTKQGKQILVQAWGVTKAISSVPLFSDFFSVVRTHASYWISHLYLTGVAAAQLWGYTRDSKNLRGTFARSKILLAQKLTSGALITPTLGWGRIAITFTSTISVLKNQRQRKSYLYDF